MHAKPGEVRNTRYTLGDEVPTLRSAAEADALVFVRGSGTLPTMGKSALGMLSPGGGTIPTLKTTMAFVDARSGDVLAFVEMEPMGDFVGNTEKVVSKMLAKHLKAIPFLPKSKAKK